MALSGAGQAGTRGALVPDSRRCARIRHNGAAWIAAMKRTAVDVYLADLEDQENEPTYLESARGIIITAERARQEIETHGASGPEFEDDGYYRLVLFDGLTATFRASDILTWLGY